MQKEKKCMIKYLKFMLNLIKKWLDWKGNLKRGVGKENWNVKRKGKLKRKMEGESERQLQGGLKREI